MAAPPASTAAVDDGHHMARGAAANALVLVASNFRGVFIFLIARLLGEAALGRFGLAFATMELLSKAGMLGFEGTALESRIQSAQDNSSRSKLRKVARSSSQ